MCIFRVHLQLWRSVSILMYTSYIILMLSIRGGMSTSYLDSTCSEHIKRVSTCRRMSFVFKAERSRSLQNTSCLPKPVCSGSKKLKPDHPHPCLPPCPL